ncbi:hypothetical protein HMPREF3213_00307, partial [Heyndrickxia coagulans]
MGGCKALHQEKISIPVVSRFHFINFFVAFFKDFGHLFKKEKRFATGGFGLHEF